MTPLGGARETSVFAQRALGLGPEPIVLASASPRRREILEMLGVALDVVPAHVDEEPEPGEPGRAQAARFAREKAEVVARSHPDRLVVAADTVVLTHEGPLSKPVSREDAARMLRVLSGAVHRVVTGVAVAVGGVIRVGDEITEVRFRPLDDGEIAAYVATDEPYDKAGGYGVQALGRAFVAEVRGCYYNVMGLPITRLRALVRER